MYVCMFQCVSGYCYDCFYAPLTGHKTDFKMYTTIIVIIVALTATTTTITIITVHISSNTIYTVMTKQLYTKHLLEVSTVSVREASTRTLHITRPAAFPISLNV